jgi:hypothetical protein
MPAAQHPANQARNRKAGAHTSSTKTPRNPKPSSTSTRGEENSPTGGNTTPLEQRGNPHRWPIVEILWIDAVADGLQEWLDPQDIHDMTPEDSRVVGYLITDTPTHVTVASLINDGSAAHALCIPRPLIHHIRTL